MRTVRDVLFITRMAEAASLAGNATRLAEKTHISRRAIGEYLAGNAEPSRPRLVAIAKAAGVSVDWLATGEGPKWPNDRVANPDALVPPHLELRTVMTAYRAVVRWQDREGVALSPESFQDCAKAAYGELATNLEQYQDHAQAENELIRILSVAWKIRGFRSP